MNAKERDQLNRLATRNRTRLAKAKPDNLENTYLELRVRDLALLLDHAVPGTEEESEIVSAFRGGIDGAPAAKYVNVLAVQVQQLLATVPQGDPAPIPAEQLVDTPAGQAPLKTDLLESLTTDLHDEK